MSDVKCCTQYGTVSEQDINALISEKWSGDGIILGTYTDKVICEKISHADDKKHQLLKHLLEARIFTENAELKISRSVMGKDFHWRLIDDDIFRENISSGSDEYESRFENRTLDEEQYLDIDSAVSQAEKGNYITTGGGKYTLPVLNAKKILIRNYIDYDDEGIAFFSDFRIVKFL